MRSSVQAAPNVTPTVDVMLVLLIIFMVVAPTLLDGFVVEPPAAQNFLDHLSQGRSQPRLREGSRRCGLRAKQRCRRDRNDLSATRGTATLKAPHELLNCSRLRGKLLSTPLRLRGRDSQKEPASRD